MAQDFDQLVSEVLGSNSVIEDPKKKIPLEEPIQDFDQLATEVLGEEFSIAPPTFNALAEEVLGPSPSSSLTLDPVSDSPLDLEDPSGGPTEFDLDFIPPERTIGSQIVDAPENLLREFAKGTVRGGVGLASSTALLGGLGADIVGLDSISESLLTTGLDIGDVAASESIAPAVGSVTGAFKNLDDFSKWVGGVSGEQLPVLAATGGGAFAGAKLVGSAAVKAKLLGASIGGAGTGGALQTGSTHGEIIRATGSTEHKTEALAVGAVTMALEMVSLGSLFKKIGVFKKFTDEAVGAVKKSPLWEGAKGAVHQGTVEAVTEGLEAVSGSIAMFTADETRNILSGEDSTFTEDFKQDVINGVREGMAAGFLVGFGTGGGGSVINAAGTNARMTDDQILKAVEQGEIRPADDAQVAPESTISLEDELLPPAPNIISEEDAQVFDELPRTEGVEPVAVPEGGPLEVAPEETVDVSLEFTPEVAPDVSLEVTPEVEPEKVIKTARKEAKTNRQIFSERFLKSEVVVDKGDPRFKDSTEVGSGLGKQNRVIQKSLSDILPEGKGSVFHETNLGNAKALITNIESGMRSQDGLFVSDNIDLALGQKTKGYIIELDATKINGEKARSMGGNIGEDLGIGSEFNIEKTIQGSIKSITAPNAKGVESLKKIKGLSNVFDFDNTIETSRGLKINRKPPKKTPIPVAKKDVSKRSETRSRDFSPLKIEVVKRRLKTLEDGIINDIPRSEKKMIERAIASANIARKAIGLEPFVLPEAKEPANKVIRKIKRDLSLEIASLDTTVSQLTSRGKIKKPVVAPEPVEARTIREVKAKDSDSTVVKVALETLPADSDGKLKKSTAKIKTENAIIQERIDKELAPIPRDKLETFPDFNQSNKKENIAAALEFKNKVGVEKAFEAMAQNKAPKGILLGAIQNVIVAEASANGDGALLARIAAVSNLQAIRQGQEVSIRSELDINSPLRYIEELQRVRIEALAKKKGVKPKEMANKINFETKAEMQKLKRIAERSATNTDWKALVKELRCP